ncbi:MAG: methyltransferase domain-containing protein [Alistipes sp.]|nr:methyltransferase domain-containing protein [Candidatus Alistipes equi]
MVLGRFIRFCLNAFPRPVLQRIASWSVPLLGLVYYGHKKRCPICGKEVKKFLPYGYEVSREDALCPRCLALERHRMLWLYIERMHTLEKCPVLLHMAPEVSLKRRIEHIYKDCPKNYITADLESPLAELHFDICKIPLQTKSIECFICNHLLEHVEDDLKALQELYRILKPGGWGLMLSPVDTNRETTFEDSSITDRHERAKIFGQYDHLRIYGRDFPQRLSSQGFKVREVRPQDFLSATEINLYSVRHEESIYILEKK